MPLSALPTLQVITDIKWCCIRGGGVGGTCLNNIVWEPKGPEHAQSPRWEPELRGQWPHRSVQG